MNFEVKINDSGFVKKSGSKIEADSKQTIANVVTRVATFMERTAKENIQKAVCSTPPKTYRRTGKARQSISRGVLGALTQRVFMGVNYGRFIEDGTRAHWTRLSNITGDSSDKRGVYLKAMKARPFWKPAIKETRANVKRIFDEEKGKITK